MIHIQIEVASRLDRNREIVKGALLGAMQQVLPSYEHITAHISVGGGLTQEVGARVLYSSGEITAALLPQLASELRQVIASFLHKPCGGRVQICEVHEDIEFTTSRGDDSLLQEFTNLLVAQRGITPK